MAYKYVVETPQLPRAETFGVWKERENTGEGVQQTASTIGQIAYSSRFSDALRDFRCAYSAFLKLVTIDFDTARVATAPAESVPTEPPASTEPPAVPDCESIIVGLCKQHYKSVEPESHWLRDFAHPKSISHVSSSLWMKGHEHLANRVDYFASDSDLDDGDKPLELDSALGFSRFLNLVKSEGDVDLTCSPEGHLCATWQFKDKRGASVWFVDDFNVIFAATDSYGQFIKLDDGADRGSHQEVIAKLVNAGLFEWSHDETSSIPILLPGIVAGGILDRMDDPKLAHSYYVPKTTDSRNTYPRIGASTSIRLR